MEKYIIMSNTDWALNYMSGIVLNIFMNSLILTITNYESGTMTHFVLQRRTVRNRDWMISPMLHNLQMSINGGIWTQGVQLYSLYS